MINTNTKNPKKLKKIKKICLKIVFEKTGFDGDFR